VSGTERAGEASTVSARVGRTMTGADRSRWLLFFGLAAAIVVVDQATKAWIVAHYDVNAASPILGDTVRIWLSHNTGALFGLFRDQALIFAAFSFAVIAIIVLYEGRAGRSLLVTVALGLLLGGALGNLADRLRLGYVVDFMDLGIGTWRWYTFNIADAAISGAVVLLLLLAVIPGLAASARDA
jgi:signal peptidase II